MNKVGEVICYNLSMIRHTFPVLHLPEFMFSNTENLHLCTSDFYDYIQTQIFFEDYKKIIIYYKRMGVDLLAKSALIGNCNKTATNYIWLDR